MGPGARGLFPDLGDILQASDNLSRVINSYKTVVEGQVINGEVATSALPDSEGKVLRFPTPDPSTQAPVPTSRTTSVPSHSACEDSEPLQAVLQLPEAWRCTQGHPCLSLLCSHSSGP